MNKNLEKNNIVSNLMEILPGYEDFIKQILTCDDSDKVKYEFLAFLGQKNSYDNKKIVLALSMGILLQDYSYVKNAIKLLKENPYSIEENDFKNFIELKSFETITFSNNDIILALGDFFELAYSLGHYYLGDTIRLIYKHINLAYSSPMLLKIKYDFRYVFSWYNDEAININNKFNHYIEEELCKCTPYEQALIYFYRGIFASDFQERSLYHLPFNYYLDNINHYFKKAKELGYILAEKFIVDEPYYDTTTQYDDYLDYEIE